MHVNITLYKCDNGLDEARLSSKKNRSAQQQIFVYDASLGSLKHLHNFQKTEKALGLRL
jgi:hypothetical protein